MTTYFITRHQGAIDWALQNGIEAKMISHLEGEQIDQGDIVIGTLPIPIIADVCSRGASYFHLSMNIPPEVRGRELSSEDMMSFGADLQGFHAIRIKS